MQKLFHLLLMIFSFCFGNSIYSQSPADKVIPGYRLKWEYYTGKADSASGYWAYTYWGVYFHYNILPSNSDTIVINLHTTHVLKNNSWVLVSKESDELLNHEQGHFNLAILCEAEFKKTMDTTTLFRYDYIQKIDATFNAVLKNIRELELQYDNETNHMLNRKEQKIWNDKIESMLKANQ
jgi:hypothetical protein